MGMGLPRPPASRTSRRTVCWQYASEGSVHPCCRQTGVDCWPGSTVPAALGLPALPRTCWLSTEHMLKAMFAIKPFNFLGRKKGLEANLGQLRLQH